MNHASVPNNLREFRLKAGLRQIDVAEHLGFSSSDRISHWENGQAYPSVPNLAKLCVLYGTSLQEIYPDLTIMIAMR